MQEVGMAIQSLVLAIDWLDKHAFVAREVEEWARQGSYGGSIANSGARVKTIVIIIVWGMVPSHGRRKREPLLLTAVKTRGIWRVGAVIAA